MSPLVEIADLSKSVAPPVNPGSDRPMIVASSDGFFLGPTPSHRSVVRFNSGSTLQNKGQRVFHDVQAPETHYVQGRHDEFEPEKVHSTVVGIICPPG